MTNIGKTGLPAGWNQRIAAKACLKEKEMKLRSGIVGSVLLAALFVSAQNVKTDYDRNYNFSQLHTFAVKVGAAWGNAEAQNHALEAITRQLTAKGWTQADEATCDALVVLNGATKTSQTFQAFYSALPHYSWQNVGAPLLADNDAYEYSVGTLVVDIFDAKTRRVVFRGVGEETLSGEPAKTSGRIDQAAKKMFEDFPPGQKGG